MLVFQVHAATRGFHVGSRNPNSGTHAYAEALYHWRSLPTPNMLLYKVAAELGAGGGPFGRSWYSLSSLRCSFDLASEELLICQYGILAA